MRKSLILVLVVVASALSPVSAASGVEVCLRTSCLGFPPLMPTFDGRVSPRKLPKNDYMPVMASIFGKIANDNAHPPALREAVVDIDKDVKLNVRGYPICRMRELTGRSTKAALKACRDSMVGEGDADFKIAFPEQDGTMHPGPLLVFKDDLMPPNRLVVFNGGEKGDKVTLLIHTFLTMPAPAAIVGTVTITRRGSGLHAVAKLSAVADGQGSLLGVNFKLGKTYEYKGKKIGYFEAKCPDGVFKVNLPELLFKNETPMPGVAPTTVIKGRQAVPCTSYG